MQAGGNLGYRNIVEIHIVAAGATTVDEDGDVTRARSIRQRIIKGIPVGGCIGGERLQQLEGGEVGRIGHHTHFDSTGIGGAGFLGPERNLERIDAVLELGEADPAGGGGAIAIEVQRTGTGVSIGGAGIRIAIGVETTTGGIATSPTDINRGARTSRGQRLETVGKRQSRVRNRDTFGKNRQYRIEGIVATNIQHTDVVVGSGSETHNSGLCVAGESGSRSPRGSIMLAVFHIPRGFVITRNPGDGDLGGRNAVDHCTGSSACGNLGAVSSIEMDAGTVGMRTSAAGGGIVVQSELRVVFIAIEAGTSGAGGVVAREATGALAGARRLVHESADDDIAHTIPQERLAEIVVLPTGSVQRVSCGAVNLLKGAGVDIGSGRREGTHRGSAYKDGEFFCIRTISAKTEIHTHNVTSGKTGSGKFGGGVDELTHGVAPAAIDQGARVGGSAIAEYDGIIGGQIQSQARQQMGAENQRVPTAETIDTAIGADTGHIAGVGTETGKSDRGSAGAECQRCGRAVGRSIYNLIASRDAVAARTVGPCEHCGTGSSVGQSDVLNTRTRGSRLRSKLIVTSCTGPRRERGGCTRHEGGVGVGIDHHDVGGRRGESNLIVFKVGGIGGAVNQTNSVAVLEQLNLVIDQVAIRIIF